MVFEKYIDVLKSKNICHFRILKAEKPYGFGDYEKKSGQRIKYQISFGLASCCGLELFLAQHTKKEYWEVLSAHIMVELNQVGAYYKNLKITTFCVSCFYK